MCLILLKVLKSAFTQASFSSLSNIYECLVGIQMAPSSLGKQTVDCDSPHDCLMSLVMDAPALCDMWGKNGINGSHLAVFNEDKAFACHFVTPRLLPPYRSASGIGYASKKLSKMMNISASYPVYSRHSELP